MHLISWSVFGTKKGRLLVKLQSLRSVRYPYWTNLSVGVVCVQKKERWRYLQTCIQYDIVSIWLALNPKNEHVMNVYCWKGWFYSCYIPRVSISFITDLVNGTKTKVHVFHLTTIRSKTVMFHYKTSCCCLLKYC